MNYTIEQIENLSLEEIRKILQEIDIHPTFGGQRLRHVLSCYVEIPKKGIHPRTWYMTIKQMDSILGKYGEIACGKKYNYCEKLTEVWRKTGPLPKSFLFSDLMKHTDEESVKYKTCNSKIWAIIKKSRDIIQYDTIQTTTGIPNHPCVSSLNKNSIVALLKLFGIAHDEKDSIKKLRDLYRSKSEEDIMDYISLFIDVRKLFGNIPSKIIAQTLDSLGIPYKDHKGTLVKIYCNFIPYILKNIEYDLEFIDPRYLLWYDSEEHKNLKRIFQCGKYLIHPKFIERTEIIRSNVVLPDLVYQLLLKDKIKVQHNVRRLEHLTQGYSNDTATMIEKGQYFSDIRGNIIYAYENLYKLNITELQEIAKKICLPISDNWETQYKYIYWMFKRGIQKSNRDLIIVESIACFTHEELSTLLWWIPRDQLSDDINILKFCVVTGDTITKDMYNTDLIDKEKLSDSMEIQRRYRYLYLSDDLYTPSEKLSFVHNQFLEDIFLDLETTKDYKRIANFLGMVIPDSVNPDTYIYNNLRFYSIVNQRTFIDYPKLSNFQDTISKIIYLKDFEIINYYEMYLCDDFIYRTRQELINQVTKYCHLEPTFYFRSERPINGNLNILSLEERVGTNENPIVAFGWLGNYSCYNIDEIIACSRDHDTNEVIFSIPDKSKEYFPLVEIKKLLNMLRAINRSGCLSSVVDDLSKAIRDRFLQDQQLVYLKKEIFQLAEKEKRDILDYLLLLFSLGWFCRFWKGVGYPFPRDFKDDNFGDPESRDTRVIRCITNIEKLFLKINKNVQNLRVIKYDFKNKQVAFTETQLIYIIERMKHGIFCLAHASDLFLESSYFYINYLFEYDANDINEIFNKSCMEKK